MHARQPSSTSTTNNKPSQRPWLLRLAGGFALAAVLTFSFLGHLTPQMQIQWANFMSMCGF